MKRVLFLISHFIFLLSFSQPSWQWAKGAGSSGYETGVYTAADTAGNVIVVGQFDSPYIVFGTDTLWQSSNSDMFIVKYDPSGNVLWSKRAGFTDIDTPAGVTTDDAGNIYVCGQ